MRIVLISPKGPLYRHRGGIFKKSLRYAPLTLTTLASLIPDELDASVQLIDEGIEELPGDLDADLIGLTVITGTAPRAYELARRYRSQGAKVVLGGPHVTLMPDEAQRHADSIVIGYAEESWPTLLRDLARGAIRPRYEEQPPYDLRGYPFPKRELLPARRYTTTNVFEATRGCKHACEFCVVPAAWGRTQFQKPVDDVVADIRQHGAKKLIFIDLNIVSDPDYARELFTALIPLRVQWHGLATTLLAEDAELLELCAKSGCKGLLIGLESARRSSLRISGKGFNDPARYPELIRKLHTVRIAVMGCFVFGFDGDDASIFTETADLAVELSIDLPRFAALTPFPGTRLFERLDREGRILTRNWELYDGQHVVFEPAQMSPAQLQRGLEEAWKRAYRYRSIGRRVLRSPMSKSIVLAANLGYRYYGHNLSKYYTCDWGLAAEHPLQRVAMG